MRACGSDKSKEEACLIERTSWMMCGKSTEPESAAQTEVVKKRGHV
jgi:hypothetical protein